MKLLVTLALLGCVATYSHAQLQCTTENALTTWMDRFYDTDPESLNDLSRTPLGFVSQEFPGSDDMTTRRPCIQVNFPPEAYASSSLSRYVYVLVQTDDPLCVQLLGTAGAQCPGHQTGRFAVCQAGVNNLTVSFVCEESCNQNSFSFYYRVVTEWRDAFDEMYCENNVNATYPISLQQVVTNPTVNPNPSEDPTGGSATLSPFVLSSILLMILLALVFMN